MEPVTAADQPAVLGPEDADELITVLRHAAAVIGALAGHPDARAALAGCPCGGEHDTEALWWDLQLAAGELTDATTAGNRNPAPENQPARNAADARKLRDTQKIDKKTAEPGLSNGRTAIIRNGGTGTRERHPLTREI